MKKKQEKKQIVMPVQAPWMISPSTPYLHLSISEAGYDDPTEAKFVAYCALEEQSQSVESWNQESVVVVPSPQDSNPLSGQVSGSDQLIKVTFLRDEAARLVRSHSGRDIVNPDLYDFSKIPYQFEITGPVINGKAFEQWRQTRRNLWIQTGLCPDPHMYEVSNSIWLRELGRENLKLKHFLLIGHDAYIEVIAEGWKWYSEGTLNLG